MQTFLHSDAPLTEETELDRDHQEVNADIVMRIAEPDTLEDIVTLSAQSDTPIVFGNTALHLDFCICNIPVKVEQASVIGFCRMYNTIYDSFRIPVEPHLLSETEYVNA